MISHSQVALDEEDIACVVKVLCSGQLVQGRAVASLEETIASFIGVNHAAAVSSGSAALHLALLALGVGENAEVIVPSYVCTALLHAVNYVGATPVVADVDTVMPTCGEQWAGIGKTCNRFAVLTWGTGLGAG